MMSIENLMQKITAPEEYGAIILDFLRRVDAGFSAEEKALRAAQEKGGNQNDSRLSRYVQEKYRAFGYETMYLVWSGAALNILCHRESRVCEILRGDFEFLLGESTVQKLGVVHRHEAAAAALAKELPEDAVLTIVDFYSYARTYGWKIAHFAGFALAETLYGALFPEQKMPQTVRAYREQLEKYLQIKLTDFSE